MLLIAQKITPSDRNTWISRVHQSDPNCLVLLISTKVTELRAKAGNMCIVGNTTQRSRTQQKQSGNRQGRNKKPAEHVDAAPKHRPNKRTQRKYRPNRRTQDKDRPPKTMHPNPDTICITSSILDQCKFCWPNQCRKPASECTRKPWKMNICKHFRP